MKNTAILLFAGSLIASSAFAGPVTYALTVNTSSVNGQTGYIDIQLDPGDPTSQLVTLALTGFSTDGTLNTSATGNLAVGDVTGTLPGTLDFDNAMTTNLYDEGIEFGNTISALLTFDGPAIESPNGATASIFLIDFLNANETANILTADPTDQTAYGWSVATIAVNPDGSTTPTTYPDSRPITTRPSAPYPNPRPCSSSPPSRPPWPWPRVAATAIRVGPEARSPIAGSC